MTRREALIVAVTTVTAAIAVGGIIIAGTAALTIMAVDSVTDEIERRTA